MGRVPYVKPGTSQAVDGLYKDIAGMGRPVLNLYRTLANQPPALAAFLEMSRYVRGGSSLDAGLRELAILATAHELGQAYEVSHHTEAAVRVGVPPEKVAAVAPGSSLDALTPALADETSRRLRRPRSTRSLSLVCVPTRSCPAWRSPSLQAPRACRHMWATWPSWAANQRNTSS